MKTFIVNGKKVWQFECEDCGRDCLVNDKPCNLVCSLCLDELVDKQGWAVNQSCSSCGADGIDFLCACDEEQTAKHQREVIRVQAALLETSLKLPQADYSFSALDREMMQRALGVLA